MIIIKKKKRKKKKRDLNISVNVILKSIVIKKSFNPFFDMFNDFRVIKKFDLNI